jgi:hypothetical protein
MDFSNPAITSEITRRSQLITGLSERITELEQQVVIGNSVRLSFEETVRLVNSSISKGMEAEQLKDRLQLRRIINKSFDKFTIHHEDKIVRLSVASDSSPAKFEFRTLEGSTNSLKQIKEGKIDKNLWFTSDYASGI